MTNSSLVSGALLSPNCSKPRNHVIDRITPHYMAGYATAYDCCKLFSNPSRKASANYCIGRDGEIWLCVEEKNRAWTSGSSINDNRAVTIECANYTDSANYGVLPSVVWDSLVKLCVDICKRNGITRINYTGNDSGNLTMHRWFQDTDCPGPWFTYQFERLANEINASLNGDTTKPKTYAGTYRCTVPTLNVRTKPSLSGIIVAQYHEGETVRLDNIRVIADGYVWGRYVGITSGEYRYLAIGPNTGKDEPTDYLVRDM